MLFWLFSQISQIIQFFVKSNKINPSYIPKSLTKMLGNLKEFISVVQDGLTSNNNLRQTLQEVQKVFKEKQHRGGGESKVNYGVGGALLEKYQEDWIAIHDNADKNAKAAEEVDKLIVELHEVAKSRLHSANELAVNLSHIPALTASVAQVMDSLKTVKDLLNTVEEELLEFEDIVERSKMENWKLDHQYHLTLYKEKKMVALEEVRNKLSSEQTVSREKQQLAELQARRDTSSVAFQHDVAKYLATGKVSPGPKTMPSPRQVSLDQIQLEDDREDLEKFLDS